MEFFSDITLPEQNKDNDPVAFDPLHNRYWKKLYQTAKHGLCSLKVKTDPLMGGIV